jgi:hypothetical protein
MTNPGVSRAVRFLAPLLAAAALAVTSLSAQGTLLGRDINGNPTATNTDPSAVFEYDTDLNITWLRDWNVNGLHDWSTQVAWASGLTVGGFSGWRLPTTNTDSSSNCDRSFSAGGGFPLQYYGFNCTGSEMGHLYYAELGNPARGPLAITDPFINMQLTGYWSGTEYAPNAVSAWLFRIDFGYQDFIPRGALLYAVAVRPGDVGAAVPEPGSLALLLGAMGALAAARCRRSC